MPFESQAAVDMVAWALFVAVSLVPVMKAKCLRGGSTRLSGPALVKHWLEREREHEFLKEVDGDAALHWVKQENINCLKTLGDPTGGATYGRILQVLDSKDKIPHVSKMGSMFYNFWQDEVNPRGIWRRISLQRYLNKDLQWETVLDVDQLGREEGESWVYKGSSYCDLGEGQESSRCMLYLSRGGSDASVVREFDLSAKRFVSGGFELPEAKSSLSWRGEDTLLVGTDLKDGQSVTDSGYPRQVREWRRGTALCDAPVVAECQRSDISCSQFMSRHRSFVVERRVRTITFYRSALAVRFWDGDQCGEWHDLSFLPEDAEVSQFADQALIWLRSDWRIGSDGTLFRSGALLVASFRELARRGAETPMRCLFEPTAATTLQTYVCTRDVLALEVLRDICSQLTFWRYQNGVWEHIDEEPRTAVRGLSLAAVDRHASNDVWMTTSSFSQPSELFLLDAAAGAAGIAAARRVQALPRAFNEHDQFVERQFMATSRDGTQVPYFVVLPRAHEVGRDVPMATLLYGYGGFEISLTPAYAPIVGCGWLQRPDADAAAGPRRCYVVANIRGGGEYGPRWHQAALRENRQRAYDDFIAVAEDLVARGLTTSRLLGIRGGSNGGLLMGNVMVQRPELFSAVCCAVPLLDMRQYSTLLAGASWMAEYGDPSVPEDWTFLQKYSPYHNVATDADRQRYPALLMTTSTRDDRVHPYHARAFSKRLQERLEAITPITMRSGNERVVGRGDVLYYENIEGGHGAAADNKQRAFMDALYLDFLAQTLREERPDSVPPRTPEN